MTNENIESPVASHFDTEVCAAVGSLIISSAISEHLITFHLLELLCYPDDSEGRYIYPLEGMDLRIKLQLIRTMAAIHFPDQKDVVKKKCRKIENAFKKRHLFAHGMVDARTSGNKICVYFVKTKESGSRPQSELLTPDHIREYEAKIWNSVVALDKCLGALKSRTS